jgi:anaerobic selenocysteine-containing dehydrogenase
MILQQVYDPDRVKVPMKRTNSEKGVGVDPKFVPISWDEALDIIAEKLLELRMNREPHKFVLLRGRYTYTRDVIYGAFTKIYGTPNGISHSAICAEAEKFGPYYTEGYWGYRQYDVTRARCIILWGADPIEANRQVGYYTSVWGEVLERAYVIVVDPRLSSSAAKAHMWLPIEPAQDGALALAIAHTLLVEGLWYKPFVGDFVDGVNRFKPGEEVDEELFEERYTYGLVKWWNLELKDRTPEWASKITGIPADKIRRVAIIFGRAAPHAISWLGGGPSMQVRGGYAALAVHALNGLVGSVDNIGGTLTANKEYTLKIPSYGEFMDEIAKEYTKYPKIDQRGYLEFPAMKKGKPGSAVVTNRVADAILNEDPYEVKMIMGYMNNFAFSCPQPQRWWEALSKVPFIVHITTHASEFTWFADIVLPAANTQMERWSYTKSHANGYRHVTLYQPVIKRLWDVKSDETEIPWLIAEKLAEKGFSNILDYYKTIKDPETGKEPTNESEFELYCVKYLTQKLWDPKQYSGGDKINGWEDFVWRGVWNSDPYQYRARWGKFKTKTKKFEFYSETLKTALTKHAEKHGVTIEDILASAKYEARGEMAFIPHYEPPVRYGDEKDYPFILIDYKSRLNREARSANCPWYYELKDVDIGDLKHEDTVKINPLDAKKLGLRSGDRIKLVSPVGEITAVVRVWEGVRPGCIAKSYGQGHWVYGRYASRKFGILPRGGNNNIIIPAEYERLSGSTAYYGHTRVRIEKIEV